MITILVLALSIGLYFYYHHLVEKCKRMIAKGGCHSEWVKFNNLKEELRPWIGFTLFLNPLLLLFSVQYLVTGNHIWDGWVIVAILNGVVCAYHKLLSYIPRFYRARFVKSPNPHHNAKWLLHCTRNSFGHAFQSGYPKTHAFFRLTARLLICNTIGHRWTGWEAVKYGDFGNSRKCKACLINETKRAGASSYCETHTRSWRSIANPNAVFRRGPNAPKN